MYRNENRALKVQNFSQGGGRGGACRGVGGGGKNPQKSASCESNYVNLPFTKLLYEFMMASEKFFQVETLRARCAEMEACREELDRARQIEKDLNAANDELHQVKFGKRQRSSLFPMSNHCGADF